MKVFVNERNEIKDVNVTSDTSLKEVEITDGTFDGWSVAKICCYKVAVSDGVVIMMTPYVDSRIIQPLEDMVRLSVPENLKLLSAAIVEDPIPKDGDVELAPKLGYKWVKKCVFIDGVPHIRYESEVDPDYIPENDGSDYLKAINWVEGMEVTEGLWYNVGDDLIWEAIKTGIPSSAEDSEYFDIV